MSELNSSLKKSKKIYQHLLGRGRLRHLQLLVAIAELGSLKRAAEQIAISQPAATQALSELEQVLETKLFERNVKGAFITSAGQELIPVVRQLLQVLREKTDVIVNFQSIEETLRIGMIPAAAAFLAKPLTNHIRLGYPALRISVEETDPSSLMDALNAGTMDMVITRPANERSDALHYEDIIADQAVILCGMHHQLVKKINLKILDFKTQMWMLPPQNTLIRQVFDKEIAHQIGTSIRINPISTSSIEVHREVLSDNSTVSIVPRSIGMQMCELGYARMLKVNGLPRLNNISIVALKDATDRSSVMSLIDMLKVASAKEGWMN